MRFLLDVNVGVTIAGALVEHGHDVVRVALTDETASDRDILQRAVVESRTLITYDRDFSDLVFHHRAEPPPAIIYVRHTPVRVADILPRLLSLDPFLLTGHLTVIGPDHVRRRPLPAKSEHNG